MIDQEAFQLLDEDTLKEMIPAVGPRVKLLKKIKELQVKLVKYYQCEVVSSPAAAYLIQS